MALVELRIGDGGDSLAVSRVLGVMSEQIQDLEDVFRTVVFPWARQHFRKQFETDGSHGGQPWVGYDNEPKYAEAKMEMVGHNRLLRWQPGVAEMLFPSLTDPNSPFARWEAGESYVQITSTVPHGPDIERQTRGPSWSGSEPSPPRIIMTAQSSQRTELVRKVQREINARVPSMDEARAHI